MASLPPPETKRQSGIALFMVLASISMLSILVTEFSYVANVNRKVAYDSLDKLKAFYLAKSGMKLSLLRLKAYQNVKGAASSLAGGAVPKALLEKIWSFPFLYPIPTNIPGVTPMMKDQIEKFQKASNLEGRFSSIIESESSKYNLNMILSQFAPTATPSASPSPQTPSQGEDETGNQPAFNPEEARNSLADFLAQILNKKFEADPDFASEYRDLRMEDLMDNIVAWADPSYEKRTASGNDDIPPKRAPFYTLSELHMIPGIDDQLYSLFAPALTVSATMGVNVNTMQDATLKALIPAVTEEEVKAFFEYRDSAEEDHLFKTEEDFLKYLMTNVAAFRNSQSEIDQFKESLTKRNIRLVVDETEFKITVAATVNQSTKKIEAWVSLSDKKQAKPPQAGAATGTGDSQKQDPGLRVTFMRIL